MGGSLVASESGSGCSVNLSSLACLIGAIVILTVIRYWKQIQEYRIYRKKLLEVSAVLPGKPGLPLIGNGFDFVDTDMTIFTLKKMSQDINATTFRIWLGPIMKIVVTDPRDFEILMGSSKAAKKDTVYDFMKPAVVDSLINGSGPVYRAHKKLVVPLINGGNLITEHIKQFNIQAKKMVARLQKKVGTGEFDVHHSIVPCVADIVFETIFGTPGKAQDGEDNVLTEYSELMLHLVYRRMMTIWMYFDAIYYLTADGKKFRKLTQDVHSFVDSIVAEKKKEYIEMQQKGIEPDVAKSDVLDQILTHVLKTNSWTDEELRYELFTLFVGSHDTIAGVSCFVSLVLAMFPDVQKKVRDELKEVVGDHNITENDAANLKYLDMVIRETIRVFPVGPLLARQMTGDLKLATCTLPKGASVYLLPFATHKDSRHWKDPEKFMPERFLPENSKDRHPWAFIPFSGGLRSCPGSKYGMICIKTIIAYLVRNFELETTMKYESLRIHAHISTRCIDGYNISLKKLKI